MKKTEKELEDFLSNLDWKNLPTSKNDPDDAPKYTESILSLNGFLVHPHRKNQDLFVIRAKDGFERKIDCYQCSSVYKLKDVIVFQGWDYNINFDTRIKRCKTIRTR